MSRVAIFWDYDSCPVPPHLTGYEVVENIRRLAHGHGSATMFKVYLDPSNTLPSRTSTIRSQFEWSGLSIFESVRRDEPKASIQVLMADMLVFAMDNPAPSTILIISGNGELAYSASLLRHRRYIVIVVAPSSGAPESLKSQASVILDWGTTISKATNERKPSEVSIGLSPGIGERKPMSDRPQDIYDNNDVSRPDEPVVGGIWTRPVWPTGAASHTTVSEATTRAQLSTSTPNSWRKNANAPSFRLRRLTSSMGDAAPPQVIIQDNPLGSMSHFEKPTTPFVTGITGSGSALTSSRPSFPTSVSRTPHFPIFTVPAEFQTEFPERNKPSLDLGPISTQGSQRVPSEETLVDTMHTSSEKPALGSVPPSPDWTSVSRANSSKTASQNFSASFEGSAPAIMSLPAPNVFSPLVEQLEKLESAGNSRPLRSLVGCELANKSLYGQAGVATFGQYSALAETMGIVQLGGTGGKAWIALQPNWRDIFKCT